MEKIKILLIEDNPYDLALIEEMLAEREDTRFSVKQVGRLAQGIKVLAAEQFHVVLLDLGLPDSQGLATLARIQEKNADTPVILLTGLDDEGMGLEAVEKGAQDYLIKGQFNASLLTRSIRYSIQRKRAEETIRKAKELSEAINQINELVDLSLDFQVIMERILEKAGHAIKADSAVIYQLENERWKIISSWGLPGIVIGEIYDPEEMVFSRFQLDGQQSILVTEQTNRRFINDYHIRSLIEAPLTSGDSIIGAFSLHYHNPGSWFSDSQYDFAHKVAKTLSMTLKNYLLYEERQKSEERYRYLFQNANDPIFIIDRELKFINVNRRAMDLFGYGLDEFVAMNMVDLVPEEQIPRIQGELKKMESMEALDKLSTNIRTKWGYSLNVEISSSPFVERNNVMGSIHIVRDVTESKKMEDEIRYQATHDILTGLANRMLFMDHLALSISQGHRYNEIQAVMFLDLDRFKSINDSLGHAAGDKLLQLISGRLKECVRETDTVARIGGDEYNILITQMAHPEDATAIANKILSSMNKPFAIDGHQLHVTISIGISLYPTDGEDAETLLKNADIALYHAKEQGRNNYQFYNPALNTRTLERVKMENRLRQALERHELVVLYQPQVAMDTGQVTGAEALVYWLHPELGLLSPGHFIPMAEEIGFITDIDEWVLETACAQNKAWQDEGYRSFNVTVNMSSKQFRRPDLVDQVRRVLNATGLPPRFLELEITEGTAMKDIEYTIPSLNTLTGMEVGFAIDDFGTGYSSLSCLKKLPIRKLKIDKSFIFGVNTDPNDKAIVATIIAMAHNLKLEVIAEGVEDADQLEFLHQNHCDQMQGFLYSRPIPAEDFRRLIM
ncbi:response receiver sensor diguanylate cyclase/phosphodiesterase, GAF and PAS domain-containing [Geotalea daltonii FRC-32]|uniref:Response receiver sensor diguanylate cyclase/phosphodiesterase, GAF and PAS domain-containing n=1 Tax=Geotalea daltonii (strain DSM 22248 / JCM 15807 / FRC-32) TaxID=316067 RepID=B9M6C9_GEODF|nr:EAL domain-containing protein [Geotalea daltonii]ACM21917.1 response receiver sensor diguanylate cyclase/phosphodiesterase, GAF and PAS domain-containing [Geotalea daltonii FRC-32]